MPRSGWHRVFHPLCGADLATLLQLIAQNGLPSTAGSLRLGIALASSIGRLPFTLAERAWTALAQHRPGPAPPPIFIVGHMRSGTTHLHNLLAASGQFATVPPVVAGMPWEALGLARVLRPFVEQYLPEDRLIDSVRVRSDSPTEDEIALANMHTLSYYHAMYFPRRFAETYRRGLLLEGDGEVVRLAEDAAPLRRQDVGTWRGPPAAPQESRLHGADPRHPRAVAGRAVRPHLPRSLRRLRLDAAARCARSCASWPCSLTSTCRSTRSCSICTRGS